MASRCTRSKANVRSSRPGRNEKARRHSRGTRGTTTASASTGFPRSGGRRSSMTVRDATEDDLPRIVEIYNTAIHGRMSTADTVPVTVESRRTWFREHTPGHRPLWVSIDGRTTAGWLSFQSFYGRPAYLATAELSVYVAPTHHRRGIAADLMRRAITASPALGL